MEGSLAWSFTPYPSLPTLGTMTIMWTHRSGYVHCSSTKLRGMASWESRKTAPHSSTRAAVRQGPVSIVIGVPVVLVVLKGLWGRGGLGVRWALQVKQSWWHNN